MSKDHYQSTVLIVDNFELRWAGLRYLVDGWASRLGFRTEATSLDQVEKNLGDLDEVKLVLLSIGGVTVRDPVVQVTTQRLRELFPTVPCGIISDRREPDEAIEAANMGEQAFFSTSMQPEVACQAFTFLLGGGTYFPREALLESAMSKTQRDNAPTKFEGVSDGLTRRQVEVLERLRQGKSNKHIARELNMQESTVKVHVRQIMRKLGAANRTQAALLAASALANRENGAGPHNENASSAAGRSPPETRVDLPPLRFGTLQPDLSKISAYGLGRPI